MLPIIPFIFLLKEKTLLMSNIVLVLNTVKTDSIPSTAFHSLTQEISLGELHEAVPRLRAHLEVQIKEMKGNYVRCSHSQYWFLWVCLSAVYFRATMLHSAAVALSLTSSR